MRSEDDAVDALRRAHRVASDQVDERPGASVRVAVIAAAARAVDAKPRPTGGPSRGTPIAMRRWPWSAAAVVTVSAMTALLASQALRDAPERITTVASPPPPAERSAVIPATPATAPSTDERTTSPRAEPGQAPKVAPGPRERREASRETASRPRPVERARADAFVEPVDREPVSRPPTTPLPSPRTAARDRATSPAAGDGASADEPREARADAAPPALLAPAARRRVGRAAEPASPEAWVERIVRLRTEGHDTEADRELEGLRRRYPDFEVPANASRASGARE